MFVIKLPMSKVKRELTSLIKTLNKGPLDLVEITRKGKTVAYLTRPDMSFQRHREPFDEEHN